MIESERRAADKRKRNIYVYVLFFNRLLQISGTRDYRKTTRLLEREMFILVRRNLRLNNKPFDQRTFFELPRACILPSVL